MNTEKFSKTTSLLIATLALAMARNGQRRKSSTRRRSTLMTPSVITFFLFFVGYISMGAAFVFFMAERNSVAPQYRTTMTISALIVGIAAFHYYYMRGVYTDLSTVSIEYRYMDWIITVPLMALKFPSSLERTPSPTKSSSASASLESVSRCPHHDRIRLPRRVGAISGMAGLILGGVGWAMIIVATVPMVLGGVDNNKIADELMWSTNALRWFICVG